jgi:pseudouridine kinase
MTKRELEILQLLKQNPLISQQELADLLHLKRSSVAVHLGNLVKKGVLKGKGYIINEEPYIIVLGGANIDIVGFSKQPLKIKDSNQGTLKISMGGVGRNIAENLVRLGLHTKLISVIGNDAHGKQLAAHSQNIGLDINDSLFLKNHPSSVHIAIMDEDNDMALGLSAMDCYEEMNLAFIKKKDTLLAQAKCIVLDTNIPKVILDYTAQNNPKSKLFLDAVAGSKANRAKDLLKYLYTLKVNAIEAEILSNISISKDSDLPKMATFFHAKGVKNVCVTLGSKGVFYSNAKSQGFIKPFKATIVNTNGAGDAFTGGFVYADLLGKSLKESCLFAMGCASLAVSHEDNVNPSLQPQIVKNILNNI